MASRNYKEIQLNNINRKWKWHCNNSAISIFYWELRKFENVFGKLQNNSLSRAELNYHDGIANNIHYGDILTIFGECLDVTKVQLPYINNDSSVDKYKASFLENGDIVFADAAEDETVGKCIEMQGLTTQTIISGLHTIPCRPKQKFGRSYLGYYLNSNAYHDQLLPLMQGTKVSSISRTALNHTYIKYPQSKKEQQKIGEFFKDLDNLITLHQRMYILINIGGKINADSKKR